MVSFAQKLVHEYAPHGKFADKWPYPHRYIFERLIPPKDNSFFFKNFNVLKRFHLQTFLSSIFYSLKLTRTIFHLETITFFCNMLRSLYFLIKGGVRQELQRKHPRRQAATSASNHYFESRVIFDVIICGFSSEWVNYLHWYISTSVHISYLIRHKHDYYTDEAKCKFIYKYHRTR